MSNSPTLTKKRILNSVYEGVYVGKSAPDLELQFLGETVSEVHADILDSDEKSWLIRCNIPSGTISDGIQTFMICQRDSTIVLDSFSISSGEPLEDDLRNEINLLREELDMLKRAFRRHCVETL